MTTYDNELTIMVTGSARIEYQHHPGPYNVFIGTFCFTKMSFSHVFSMLDWSRRKGMFEHELFPERVIVGKSN